MFSLYSLFFIFVLASRVLSFTITVGTRNLTTADILNIPDNVVKSACTSQCTTANSQIQACGDDASCLCKNETVSSLLTCEQCMFTKLIEVNQRLDFRVGSNVVLSGYSAACKATANITLAPSQTALKLPPTWDGPFVAVLPLGGTVVAVGTGALLGLGALLLFSSI